MDWPLPGSAGQGGRCREADGDPSGKFRGAAFGTHRGKAADRARKARHRISFRRNARRRSALPRAQAIIRIRRGADAGQQPGRGHHAPRLIRRARATRRGMYVRGAQRRSTDDAIVPRTYRDLLGFVSGAKRRPFQTNALTPPASTTSMPAMPPSFGSLTSRA